MPVVASWFQIPEVHEWRQRVVLAYSNAMTLALRVRRPDLLEYSDSPDRSKRDEMRRFGRTGSVLELHEEALTTYQRQKREKTDARRKRFAAALDELLMKRSLQQITVDMIVKATNSSRYVFYQALCSGLPGLYCYWATQELEQFADLSRQNIWTAFDDNPDHRQILNQWVSLYSNFLMDKPHGRLPIFGFTALEIDRIGSSWISELRDLQPTSSKYKSKEAAINELSVLAASLHRAGARVITTIMPLFLTPSSRARIWPLSRLQSEDVPSEQWNEAWNAAHHFWQSISVGVVCVGPLESRLQSAEYRKQMLKLWDAYWTIKVSV